MQTQPQTFDEVVEFYEMKMQRRRVKVAEEDNSQCHEVDARNDDIDISNHEPPATSIRVTQ